MFDAAPIKKVSVVIPVYNEQEKPAGIDKTHHRRLRESGQSVGDF